MMQKRSDKDYRPEITLKDVSDSSNEIFDKLISRLEEKGWGAWLSRHEILGFLTEEYTEAVDAVHAGTLGDIKGELKDIAVGCIFAIACIDNSTLDW